MSKKIGKEQNIKDLYKECKIDWTDFSLIPDEPLQNCFNNINFEMKPKDYLKFAKRNILEDSKQGRIDGLGNVKRAIECQMDLLTSRLGFDYKIFDNRTSYKEIKNYIEKKYEGETIDGIVPRIKLLNVLELAPTILISEIRNLRNKMEHEYICPSIDSVKRGIEVAELFIHSSNKKFLDSPAIITIGNDHYKDCGWYKVKPPSITMIFPTKEENSEVVISLKNPQKDNKEFFISPDNVTYIKIIEMMITMNEKLVPSIFGFDIDEKFIKCNPNNLM